MDDTKCTNCGIDLSVVDESAGEKPEPCPNCGSVLRTISVSVRGEVKVSDHVAALSRREGKAVGFTESMRDGRASWAEHAPDGSQSFGIVGTAPQGEDDTLECCRILIQRLNADGGHWSDPELSEGNVDCQAHDTSDRSRVLRIQVVRACVDRTLWEELNTTHKVEKQDIDVAKLTELLIEAISKKANNRRIPEASRQTLYLALDATRLPGFAFDDTAANLRSVHRTWIKTRGFKAVWVVGPSFDLTWRVDD